jgi:hypothetical protein
MRYQINKITIHKGNDEQFLVHLIDAAGSPISISGATAIAVELKNTDSTILERIAYTGLNVGLIATINIYAFSITAAESALLQKGVDLDLILKVSFSSFIQQLIIPNAMTVLAAQ